MQDAEIELIMWTLVDTVQTYGQVVPPHNGHPLPMGFGLFH